MGVFSGAESRAMETPQKALTPTEVATLSPGYSSCWTTYRCPLLLANMWLCSVQLLFQIQRLNRKLQQLKRRRTTWELVPHKVCRVILRS